MTVDSVLLVNVCLRHRILRFATEPLRDSFLLFHNILESVATKMLLQRTEKFIVTSCQVRTVW